MEVLLFTCAETAIVDGPTNRLSMFNLAEEFAGAALPGIIPSLAVIIALSRESSEPDNMPLSVACDMNGKQIFEVPITASFQGKLRTRVVANLQGVPITSHGVMKMLLKSKRKVIGTWPIIVSSAVQVLPPPVQVASATTVGSQPAQTTKKSPKRRKAKR
jgi:hypothetical protein